MGEERHEVSQALRDLHEAGTDILTITQYLRPSPRHLPVARWVHPDEFVELKEEAEAVGFLGVLAGPLARSSYRAGRLYARSMAAKGRPLPEALAHLGQEREAFAQAVP
jgi:lipoic acid synthetase